MVTESKLQRLDFSIPEFVRTAWASEAAREYWEPKISRLSNNWKFIERLTLTQEMRRGILQSITPEELPELQIWALQNNIPLAIVAIEGASISYGNASRPYRIGESFTYRVYFGMEPERFLNAWRASDDLAIGNLLGFPECCSRFFKTHWKEEGWRDYTALTFDDPNQKNLMYNNVLLRHIGIRGVFHLPCSVSCKPSCQIGMRIMEIMKFAGYDKEVEWLKELLAMPMAWSSLHGIAMVVTPILKTIYASDPLPEVVKLNLQSDYYPKEGASGNQFPFIDVMPLHFSRDFNGFKSYSGMQDAHRFILQALPEKLQGKILDLGCGTGHLLQAIQKEHPTTQLFGIEFDLKITPRVAHWKGNIYDFLLWEETDLTLIAIQRFFEVEDHKVSALLEVISNFSKQLLIYSYDGWYNGVDKWINQYFVVLSVARDPIMNMEAKLLGSKTWHLI